MLGEGARRERTANEREGTERKAKEGTGEGLGTDGGAREAANLGV